VPILLEVVLLGVLALLAARFVAQPWRARAFNALKAWLTVRILWALLMHPVDLKEGGVVPAWRLIVDTVRDIDAGTFLVFVLLGTAIRMLGVLASMVRWQLLLRGQGIELPFRHVFGSFLIGRAIGFFLPSTAGLDAYLVYDAARFSGRTVEVTAGKFLEKVLGVSGIFLSFLVALPFGIAIFGDNGPTVAVITVPISLGVIGALLLVLLYPRLVQWILETLPLPGKQGLSGLVTRVSNAAAAYRDKYGLVAMVLFLSFAVHFTTAAMYYFTALAIGVGERAEFWPIAFGSSIQIFATVVSPFTIGGMGIREAAQYALLGNLIGAGPAIISGALGFWVGEFPTLFGFAFWFARGPAYRPAYCRVDGEQVDYEQAARAATELETPEEKARREREGLSLPPLGARVAQGAGLGLGAGVLAGLLLGIPEAAVVAAGGLGSEGQVLWYAPLVHAVLLAGLGLAGGAVLSLLPMTREEIRGWVPSLTLLLGVVPLGLAITIFRLRRDVYMEQMPPMPVLVAVLAGSGVLALALFFGGRRLFAGRAGALVRPFPAVALLVVVLVAGGLGSAAVSAGGSRLPDPEGVPAELASRPNIVLVMVDTLRADHLSCYGATGIETPNMCRLAGENGTRFEGFAHASWTKPSTASLVTSLLPSSHQAMSKAATLPRDVDHVAEVLQERGYATGGIASNINLAPSFGFDQGYDEYHYLGPDYLAGARESSSKLILYQIGRAVWFKLSPGLRFGDFYQDSQVVNRYAFDFLERYADSRFFLFLHYMDPHDPYFEHPYNGRGVARVSTPEPDPELAEELRRLYAGEIEYLDGNFGRFLARLEELGLWEDTLVVLTSDHGEEFHEHGGWWHGLTLYDEQIRVPLLVKWPEGQRPDIPDGAMARHLDVVPTLLGRAGASVPSGMQGSDLLERNPDAAVQVYSEEDHEGNVLWSLRTESEKLIRANPDNPRGLPERAYYRVDRDPGETENLAGETLSSREQELEQLAESHRSFAEGEAVAGESGVEMDREECEQLRMLGYVEDCSHLN